MDGLNPQARAVVDAMQASGVRPFAELSVAEARRDLASATKRWQRIPHPGIARTEELTIETSEFPLSARRYTPRGEIRGTMLHYHGGGWVIGELDDFDGLCEILAVTTRCEVVSVAYRLAPEHVFPAGVDDAFAALVWARRAASDRPLLVVGESAGGNLAAAVALRAHNEGGPELAAQILLYPVTDHDFETTSYRRFGSEGPIVTRADMEWFWDHYVPDRSQRDDPMASPLRAADLRGLPPAVMVLAGVDPMHDEGAAYARRLQAAGVPVTLLEYPDMPHGFCSMYDMLDDAVLALEAVAAAVCEHTTGV